MRVWSLWCWIPECQVVGLAFTQGHCGVQSCLLEHGALHALGLLKRGKTSCEPGQILSRSVSCIIMALKASQIGVISDGLWFGKTQVVEKVLQQVGTLGELGSNTK